MVKGGSVVRALALDEEDMLVSVPHTVDLGCSPVCVATLVSVQGLLYLTKGISVGLTVVCLFI